MLARLQTLRPLSGNSTIARSPIVSETVARSVSSTCASADTFTDSVTPPTWSVAFVRTTWLVRDLDAGRLERLKARDRDRDLIPAGTHERDVVGALGVRRRLVGIFGAGVDGDDLRAGHDEAAAIGNRPDQRGLGRELCRSIRCQTQAENQRQRYSPSHAKFLPFCRRRDPDVRTLRVCRPDDKLSRYLFAPGAGTSVQTGREMPLRSQTTCPPLTVSSHSSF